MSTPTSDYNNGHDPNSGHGHVYKRPDGVKARCGGPPLCSECARDMAALQASYRPQQPVAQVTSKASIVISRLRSALAQLLVEYEDVPDATDADGQALFQEARNAIAAADRYSGETGEQQPVAYVPIHPRTGPLWANTIPTLESERPAHYPLMALYAEPAYRDGKETVVRTNQGDSDCVMTGDWPLTRERDAASHPPSCVCYTCIQNRWRASQKAEVGDSFPEKRDV